jgi:hypothetical protein
MRLYSIVPDYTALCRIIKNITNYTVLCRIGLKHLNLSDVASRSGPPDRARRCPLGTTLRTSDSADRIVWFSPGKRARWGPWACRQGRRPIRCRMPWPHQGKPRLWAASHLGSWKLFQRGGLAARMCYDRHLVTINTGNWSELNAEHAVRWTGVGRCLVTAISRTSGFAYRL